jgi:archaeal flagellar protein FlaJ
MFTSISEYKEEKKATVSPYVMMVYVSSLVFLFIGYVMITQFLMPLANQDKSIAGISQLVSKMLPIDYYKTIIFWGAILEGLLGGLVVGKISESRVLAGLIHSVALIAITYIFYSVLL